MIIDTLANLKLGRDFEALFFDFDGVLADTEPIHFQCWRELLRPRGIELTWDYYEGECIGVADRAMLERLGALANPPQVPDELFDIYPLKKKLFAELSLAALPILPETIAQVKRVQKLPLAVVTSSGMAEVQPMLNKVWGEGFFTTVVYGNEVKNLKPSPEPYLEASRRCGIRRAIVFEDSDAGAVSATGAGHLVYRIGRPADLPLALAQFSL